jgi:hypothetical protein
MGSALRTNFDMSHTEFETLQFHPNGTRVPRDFHTSSKSWKLMKRREIIQQRIYMFALVEIEIIGAQGLEWYE